MALQTRVPQEYGYNVVSGEGVYAWQRDTDGNLVQTGYQGLTAGQAWTYDDAGNLVDAGTTITDDPFWERIGDNLVEIPA